MEVNKFNVQVPTAAPKIVSKPVSSPMFARQTPKFGNSGDGNAPRTGVAGLFAWIGRAFNRFILGRHENEDQAMAKNPIPFLTAEQNTLVQDFEKSETALQTVMATRNVEVIKLTTLKTEELKEKKDAEAALLEFKAMTEADEDYQAQKEEAELQAQQWKAAKEKTTEQQSIVDALDIEADEAENTLATLREQVKEMEAAITKAKRKHTNNQTFQRIEGIVKKAQQYKGERIAYSDQTASLIDSINVESERLQISLGGGKDKEARRAALRAKKRVEGRQASAVLQELEAELSKETKKDTAANPPAGEEK